MASHTMPPAGAPDSELMNYAVRMVTPLRREFGTSLDVRHFLHDFAYAREIIEQAKSSQDLRLREYADYLETKLFGPRNGPERTPRAQPAPEAAAAPAAPATAEPELSEAELRQRMMSKYKSGLR